MIRTNKRGPELGLPRRRDAAQTLASYCTLLLFFNLIAAVFARQALGDALFRQSAQQSRVAGSDENEVHALESGRSIKRELGGGQEHVYRIMLNADQFLKVIVEQQGIDIVAQVSGPDGKQILEFDSESRLQGREEVSLVAEAAGDYRLTIQPKQKMAQAGNYEVRIEESRVATDTDRALHDARKRFEEALKLRVSGKTDEALQCAERALEIREKLLGAERLETAAALDLLAGIYTDRSEYAKAEPLCRRGLSIREKALSNDHPDIANSLDNLASNYYYQGKYVEAEPLFKRVLDIREKALGGNHPSTSDSLTSLAIVDQAQGKYVEAEPLFKRAIDINEIALGKDHPSTARSLTNLGALYVEQGKYEEAEPLYARALSTHEKAPDQTQPDLALSLNNMAELYRMQGKYREAEPLYKRALDIREKMQGEERPDTALALNNLALLYYEQGRYAEAEPLYKRALGIYEKALGKDHPDTSLALNNLAALYTAQGRYAEAEPIYKLALSIREKALGKDHPGTATSLNNLACLYRIQERYEEAESLFKRSLGVIEKELGRDHKRTATSLNNLAFLYYQQGKYVDAEPLYKRAIDIREKTLGKDHPDTALGFSNLALLYASQGKYGDAEALYKLALGIREKALGNDHPDTALCLDNLARLYMAKEDPVQAIKFQSLADAARERNLASNLVIGSERQKLAYLAILSQQTDRTISLHIHSAPNDSSARNLAATLILQRKGRALDATSQNLNALRRRFNPEDQALLDRLTETQSQIARLVIRGPQKMTGEQYQARIKELENQAEKEQFDVSRRSEEFRAQYLPVTLESVREAIPPDSALIEFASYRQFNAKALKDEEAYGRPRYVVYILRHDGEIGWKELGDAKAIDTAIVEFRKALRDPKRADVKRLAREVDVKVFQPIRPLLGNATRLLISPDGSLNLIPFAALVDERWRYAVERYSISYLTSGRDLLRLQTPRENKDGPLLVAAPDFGRRNQVEVAHSEKQEKVTSEAEIKEDSARSAINEFYFPPLPYAAQEGEALRALVPGATLLTKDQATKAALGQIRSPKLLHIATHSFFLEDQQLTSLGERGAQTLSDDPERAAQQLEHHGVRIESPLLRSGLALAGANEHKEDDNGILTALEVTGLNLWGTKLVTLSACDTGVGEVRNGDGVYGLRRALVLAGAETQVMSLWAVSDKATRELMVSYYRRLQDGQGRGEALRQSQLEMLKNLNRRHPYYWASFIQSGEWANLGGKRDE